MKEKDAAPHEDQQVQVSEATLWQEMKYEDDKYESER